MKIYWTIHSIPELASLPRSGRRKAFRLASRDLLKNSKERLYGFLFCLVVIGIALGILTILRPMGLGTLGRITFMLLVGYVSFVIQLHYLMPKLRLYLRTHVENLKPRDERMKMNNNLENFKKWFSGILENIYPNQNAGFVILMISFPLLERYLREKSGVHEGKLNDDYYTNLRSIFPELSNIETAKEFWQVFRNGILHQATLSKKTQKGIQMPRGGLSFEVDMISIEQSDRYWINPINFSKKVLDIIAKDFEIYEGKSSTNHPLPTVKQHPTILGTNVD